MNKLKVIKILRELAKEEGRNLSHEQARWLVDIVDAEIKQRSTIPIKLGKAQLTNTLSNQI